MTLTSTNYSDEELFPRFGRIVQVHPEHNKVSVDFDGNSMGTPIWAAIGRAFTRAEIHLAIDNQLTCKIEFLANDPTLPILTDVYCSLLGEETMVIKAERVVLEGKQEVMVRSQDTSCQYNGRTGRITTKAQFVTTEAEKTQKIKAQKIDLN